MPSAMITSVPGRIMPRKATRAPGVRRSRSPTRMLMLVAFNPGKVWLISSAPRNSSSSSQRRFSTSISRRYATTPPPKLVAPMKRKVRKMAPSETGPGGASLTVGHRGVPVPVDHAGLGRVRLHPLPRRQLKGLEELLRPLLGLVMQLLVALELALKGELTDQRNLWAPVAPDGDVGLGAEPVAEVHLADVGQHLLGGQRAHQPERRIGRRRELVQGREERGHLLEGPVAQERRAAQGAAVGEEAPDPAEAVAQGQQFLLELDEMAQPCRRPHVHRRRGLHIGMAELQHHLVLVLGPALPVDGALAQDELAVVEMARR